MPEHKHAEFLRAIADGESLSDWEIKHCTDQVFIDVAHENVRWIISQPKHYTLRRKPKTVTRTIRYPQPMREAPAITSRYWVASADNDVYAYAIIWGDRRIDKFLLRRGICHATEEAAIAHGKAMAGVSDD